MSCGLYLFSAARDRSYAAPRSWSRAQRYQRPTAMPQPCRTL